MKQLMISILVALLVSLMAVVAFAQEAESEEQEGQQVQQAQQNRNLNYLDSPGIDAHGGIERHGADFAGDREKHGPFGPGPDEDGVEDSAEFFSEGLEETPVGQMLQHRCGPGESTLEPPSGPFGPNSEEVGFGLGDPQAGDPQAGDQQSGEPQEDVGSGAPRRAGQG
ncbi:MAG: hypothetical protein KOO60_03225 [Gemmatimonadales bacterium]|nr:hypothetical protein [Gemmatimonadales bacterium]